MRREEVRPHLVVGVETLLLEPQLDLQIFEGDLPFFRPERIKKFYLVSREIEGEREGERERERKKREKEREREREIERERERKREKEKERERERDRERERERERKKKYSKLQKQSLK